MKLFTAKQVRDAIAYGDAGGQALHVWSPPQNETKSFWPGAPVCFQNAGIWAHLIDRDLQRLKDTARKFGVRKIKISSQGRSGQHVDLCGRPLDRAMEQCFDDQQTAGAK